MQNNYIHVCWGSIKFSISPSKQIYFPRNCKTAISSKCQHRFLVCSYIPHHVPGTSASPLQNRRPLLIETSSPECWSAQDEHKTRHHLRDQEICYTREQLQAEGWRREVYTIVIRHLNFFDYKWHCISPDYWIATNNFLAILLYSPPVIVSSLCKSWLKLLLESLHAINLQWNPRRMAVTWN